MTLSQVSRRQFTPNLNMCRSLNDIGQVPDAHGRVALGWVRLFAYLDTGYTTLDLVDHCDVVCVA